MPQGAAGFAKYTPEERKVFMEWIVELITENGMSFKEACKHAGVPRNTVRRWANDYSNLNQIFVIAQDVIIDGIEDEIVGLADNVALNQESIQKVRHQIESRKWIGGRTMSQLGEKQYHKVGGDGGEPLKFEAIERVVVDPSRHED